MPSFEAPIQTKLENSIYFLPTTQTNGKTDTDETKGGAEYDALFHDQLAWYLRSDFEHDPIEQPSC